MVKTGTTVVYDSNAEGTVTSTGGLVHVEDGLISSGFVRHHDSGWTWGDILHGHHQK